MEDHRHWRDPISRLCQYLQVSRSTLDRVFDAVLHIAPSTRFLELRMESAQQRLQQGKISIKQLAYDLGYKHPSNFSRALKTFRSRAGRSR